MIVTMHVPNAVAHRSVGGKCFSLSLIVDWGIGYDTHSGGSVHGLTSQISLIVDINFNHTFQTIARKVDSNPIKPVFPKFRVRQWRVLTNERCNDTLHAIVIIGHPNERSFISKNEDFHRINPTPGESIAYPRIIGVDLPFQ